MMNDYNEFDMSENEETVKELLKKSIKLQNRLCRIGGWIIFLLLVIMVLVYLNMWN